MKRLLLLLCTSLFISCSSDNTELNRTELDTKDLYLQSNLPKILQLNQSEINHFKKYMVLNERGASNRQNNDDGCFKQENSTCIIVVKEIKPVAKFPIDSVQ